MTLARTVEIVRQVAGALDVAHAEGVVHRDLKSDNIMLQEATGGDWAKVLDFGIAKIQQTERSVHETDPGLTAPNLIIGTPQYMSPEQCSQASDIDARSDIYSFGVIVYEMLVGHVPFSGDSPTGIMMKHIQEPPPSILAERPDLPAAVGRVVERALAKRPEERFQSAGELSAALAEAAAEAPAASVAAAALLDTERIGSPTSPNEPARTTLGRTEEEDEATVVSAGHAPAAAAAAVVVTPADELPPPVAPLPESSFSPWRVAIPAIAIIAIVFAVFFAFQRRGVSSEQAQPDATPLQADPNGQAAQPISPPTGQAEHNLSVPSSSPTPSTAAAGGVAGTVPGSGEANPNAVATPMPTPGGKSNANQTQPADDDDNADAPTPTPTPKRNRPINVNANVEAPPPAPPPKEEKPKEEKPKEDKPPALDNAPPGPVVKPF